MVKKKGICLKCLKSLQRIKHKDIADCKWSNCDNCNQNHHPLLCDRPRGSQAVLKASYEEDTGEEEDRNDEMDNIHFAVKDGEYFFASGEDTNDAPVEALEEGMYFRETIGVCNEEDMIQDEVSVMRFSVEEDTEPFEEVMHASVKTESAVLIES